MYNGREWRYVGNHAKAIDLDHQKGREGEVDNVGGYNEETNINIVKLIIRTIKELMETNPQYQTSLKTDLNQINDSLITYVGDRLGHDMRYAIDPTKIVKELGWYPETPFEDGIRKTVIWYLENQEWVESVVSGDYQKYYDQMYLNR